MPGALWASPCDRTLAADRLSAGATRRSPYGSTDCSAFPHGPAVSPDSRTRQRFGSSRARSEVRAHATTKSVGGRRYRPTTAPPRGGIQ